MTTYRATCYRETWVDDLSLDEAIERTEAHVLKCPSGPMPQAIGVRWYRCADGSYVSAHENYGWLDHTVRPERA